MTIAYNRAAAAAAMSGKKGLQMSATSQSIEQLVQDLCDLNDVCLATGSGGEGERIIGWHHSSA